MQEEKEKENEKKVEGGSNFDSKNDKKKFSLILSSHIESKLYRKKLILACGAANIKSRKLKKKKQKRI